MATLQEILDEVKKLNQEVSSLPGRINVSGAQVIVVNGLSDISERLGLFQAGEFRAGNRVSPGDGFSGVRMVYPPVTYGGRSYNIAGVDADTLMVGIGATDGVLYAGGGAVVLDVNGLAVNDTANLNALRVFAIDQTYNGESIGAGDVLIGDNSSDTGNPNMLWDASAGRLYARDGTIVAGEISGGTFVSYGVNAYLNASTGAVADSAASSDYPLTFSDKWYDNGGFLDTTTSTSDYLTVPVGLSGLYQIGFWVQWDANAAGARMTDVGVNGSLVPPEVNLAASPNGFTRYSGMYERSLSSGDVLELYVTQTSGSTLDVGAAAMWLRKIG